MKPKTQKTASVSDLINAWEIGNLTNNDCRGKCQNGLLMLNALRLLEGFAELKIWLVWSSRRTTAVAFRFDGSSLVCCKFCAYVSRCKLFYSTEAFQCFKIILLVRTFTIFCLICASFINLFLCFMRLLGIFSHFHCIRVSSLAGIVDGNGLSVKRGGVDI